ncbi:hypothetical protein B0H34DRAFT_791874 [Crassisporium funariophilum]|nr:hypothetical protein B0H34DRAFT_791874 [Crassisporium funariophilum]
MPKACNVPETKELDAQSNPWAPFEDRLTFDWAQYQYVELQSSEAEIGRGLDLWLAAIIKSGFTNTDTEKVPIPWCSAQELYATIDSIQAGGAPWMTHTFRYNGPKPESPPNWMEETYELNVRDILIVLEGQLATVDFHNHFDYKPYREYDANGNRVWSNLMSGSWAYEEATELVKDRDMHGAMLVPVLAGSDKTTVSVATGHQEYLPVYASPGNISNAARRGHGNGVLPFAFLPIPKASKTQRKKPVYQQFCRQLYHKCLEVAFSPLKAYMTDTKQIDSSISAVPAFPSLRQFPDGRDFNQWTGDDSKALMKVYIAAIAGYVPSRMVRSRRNMISEPVLDRLRACVAVFHELRDIFITSGVRVTISLPRQHALVHYPYSIPYFGSPNGTCSSITESKHIKAVKEPWRRSNRYKALSQMLRTIMHMEKMASLRRIFAAKGMMVGTTSSYTATMINKIHHLRTTADHSSDSDTSLASLGSYLSEGYEHIAPGDVIDLEVEDDEDSGPVCGNQPSKTEPIFDVQLSARRAYNYPRHLQELSEYTTLPMLPTAFRQFLFECDNPNTKETPPIDKCPDFYGRIYVHHSTITTYFSPSNVCGAGGMHRERIRSNPSFFGHPRRDTVFVVLDDTQPGMRGMVIARVLLFLSFHYRRKDYSCALVNWFVREEDEPDEDTGMWTVHLEEDLESNPPEPIYQVIDVNTIARGAHLLPVFGSSRVPDNFSHHDALDSYRSFFVNHFVDHHAHEFLTP